MKIGIAGCAGRMGKMLMEAVREHPECTLSVASTRSEGMEEVHTYLEREGLRHVLLTDDLHVLASHSDAVIDFTAPDYSLLIAETCAAHDTIMVCGTTGFSDDQHRQLIQFATKMRLIHSANFSIGVNLLLSLTSHVASILGAAEYDIEITDLHHRHKKDAPSGTALALGEAAAQGRGVRLFDVADRARDGITGERKSGAIGFHALRGGDVIGDHTVLFAGEGERLELTHKSSDRSIYAKGALRAAQWARQKSNGYYSMQDVLARPKAE
jgi:4-hydroxy-tetrahydrodipicolinate reductase